MSGKVTVSFATAADMEAAFGSDRASVRAWKAELDGRIVGIGGVTLCRPPAAPTVFLKVLDGSAPKMSVYRAVVEGLRLIRSAYSTTLYAVRDCGKENSAALLAKAGFAPHSQDREGKEIWAWALPQSR